MDMIQASEGKYWHDGQEITFSEYEELFVIIKQKARLVDEISAGTSTLDDCPAEWRDEIAARVEARQNEQEPDPDADEILSVLLGGAAI